MGFFSDLKEDLNQAVSEFRPDDAPQEAQEGPGQPVPEGSPWRSRRPKRKKPASG